MVHCVGLAVKYKRRPFDDGLFSDFEIASPDHEWSYKSLSFTRNNTQISKGTDLTRCCRAVNNPSSKENSQAKDQIFWVTMRENSIDFWVCVRIPWFFAHCPIKFDLRRTFWTIEQAMAIPNPIRTPKTAEKLYILSFLFQIPPSNVQTKFLTLDLVHKLLKPEKKQTNMKYRHPFLQNIIM